MTKFQLGDQAPDFSAVTAEGDTFQFYDHLNQDDRFHLLIFFRGEWCPVCKEQLQDLEEHKDIFSELNTHIVSISTDEKENLAKLKEDSSLSFPVLSDKDREVINSYGVYYHDGVYYDDHESHGEPAAFLIDPQKRIVYLSVQTGPFGRPSAEDLRKTIKYIQKTLK
ncbi:peroxiredoxin family protein [Fictibacillus fluitans]|uniref:Peroxiredoxin family protein n=1 Tax=Fictibacillus fluitans TaxID=3058422 RepID=A0ABT8HXZ8_9BACL|nr:peroxiredoxin family protein [Fictibacillus sp. NE201]MDN4525621.1 peroxiredoxin family protein [Fictibacillus sp. NE201]